MEKRRSLLDLPTSLVKTDIRMGGRTSMGMGAMGSLPMRSLDLPMGVPKTKGAGGMPRIGELRMSGISTQRGMGSMGMKMPSHALDLDMKIPSARRAPMQAPQMQMAQAQPAQLQAYPAPQPIPLQQPSIQKAYGMGRVSTAPYQGTTVQVYTGSGRPRTIVSQQKGLIVDRFGRVIGRAAKRPVGRPRTRISLAARQPIITEKAAQEIGKATKEVLLPAGKAIGKGVGEVYKKAAPVVISKGKQFGKYIKEKAGQALAYSELSAEEKAQFKEKQAVAKAEAKQERKQKLFGIFEKKDKEAQQKLLADSIEKEAKEKEKKAEIEIREEGK